MPNSSIIQAACNDASVLLLKPCASCTAGAQEVAQQQGMSKTMQQLLQSSKRLIKLKFETQQAVSAVKVQSDEQESLRRQKDERMRQVRA
jgi:hypothetical protein